MDAGKLQDRIDMARGRAARHIGHWHSLMRPIGLGPALYPGNRVMRLPATFLPLKGGMAHPPGYGEPLWQGVFDTAYTKAGDYLLADGGAAALVWFIAAQDHLLPPICVRANARVTMTRAAAPQASGSNPYGSPHSAPAVTMLESWPVSMLTSGSGGSADLPAALTPGTCRVLLPAPIGLSVRGGDQLTDHQGRSFTVADAEQTRLGWRLRVQQNAA